MILDDQHVDSPKGCLRFGCASQLFIAAYPYPLYHCKVVPQIHW